MKDCYELDLLEILKRTCGWPHYKFQNKEEKNTNLKAIFFGKLFIFCVSFAFPSWIVKAFGHVDIIEGRETYDKYILDFIKT